MSAADPLIGANDPPPFERINPEGKAPLLLTCDHASCAVPAALKGLGLSEEARKGHIGWDIGIAPVVRRMSALLDAPAVLGGYSRLVIDLNRPRDSTREPGSIPWQSDGVEIPGNRNLTGAEAEARERAFFRPYHDAIREILDDFQARGVAPAYVAMHSFAPKIQGVERPWQIGVAWRSDPRLPRPLVEVLRRDFGLCVGENEPYPIEGDSDYGVPVHGEGRGLPHALIEIRQDLLLTEEGRERWAQILAEALAKVLGERSMLKVRRRS